MLRVVYLSLGLLSHGLSEISASATDSRIYLLVAEYFRTGTGPGVDSLFLSGPGYPAILVALGALFGDIEPEKRSVLVRGEPISLTAKEFDLLLHFARQPGRVFTRSQLLDSVWGYGHDGYEHTVNSHINRLRAKVEEDPTRPQYIQTVWGVGYRFGGEL